MLARRPEGVGADRASSAWRPIAPLTTVGVGAGRRSAAPAAGRAPCSASRPISTARARVRRARPSRAARGSRPSRRPTAAAAGRGRRGRRAGARRGWATRSPTGWSSRCSAACTPAGPTRCRCARRCRRWRRALADGGSLVAGRARRDRAARRPSAGAGVRLAAPAASAGCRRAGRVRPVRGAHRRHRARDPPRRRPASCSTAAPCRRRYQLRGRRGRRRRRRPAKAARLLAERRARRGRRAGRHRDRAHGDRDLRLRRDVDAAAGQRPAGRRARGPGGQGGDALVAEVAAATTGGLTLLRASVGRAGEARVLQRDDAELVALVRHELRRAARHHAPSRSTRSCTRWGGGLPQYAVGHVDRVARIRAAVAAVPGLAVCGAAYDGVGIPACIASAHARPTGAGRAGCQDNEAMVDGKTGTRTQRRHPLHRVVGVHGRPPARRGRPRARSPPRSTSCSTQLAAKDVVGARHLRRVGAAGRRRPDDLVARRRPPTRCRRPTRGSAAPRSARTSSRSGRTWRCTARPSSTRATCRRSWPTRRPRAYVCVYPFVRSYEWYLLPDDERRALLAEHGQMAREYPDVRANTVVVVRARRLRVDAGLRGRRAAPHRRPDAAPARLGDPPARARGGAVLHRPPPRASPSSSTPCP